MTSNSEFSRDSAAQCIALILRLHGESVDAASLREHFETRCLQTKPNDVVAVLAECGFTAQTQWLNWKKLANAAVPAIVHLQSGGYALLAKVSGNEVLVQMPGDKRAAAMSKDDFEKVWSGEVMVVSKTPAGEVAEPFGFKWLFKSMMRYRTIFSETLAASAFIQLFALVTPLVFMLVIDKVLSHNSMSTLTVLLFALVVVTIFDVVLNGLRSYLMSHTTSRIDLDLAVRTFRKLLNLPLGYFESRRVGDTIARMRELETVRHFMTGSGLTLILDLAFVVLFLIVMFLFSKLLTLIVVIALPLFFMASYLMTPLLKDKLDDKYALGAENQSFLVEAVSGIETVKSAAAEPWLRQKWEAQMTAYNKAGFAGGTLATFTNQFINLLSKVLVVVLLGVGANLVMAGALTVGQLIAFNMLSGRVTAPIVRLSQIWQELQQMRISTERVADVLDAQEELSFAANRTMPPALTGQVAIEKMSFRYQPDGAEILKDVDVTVKPGQVVGIIGSSGSGKTTLVKLLQRLYVPEQGRITMDGMNLATIGGDWLRQQVGVVAQDCVLFDVSVRENIALGLPEASMEEITYAAQLAGAHEFIVALPQGYDTLVGERGGHLSAGQRQRIAIARALVSNPKILILDEATSNLDYESEQAIRENMKTICKGRTVFIVTHRISSLDQVDMVLTIEDGRIIEQGTPKQLLKKKGRYAQLHTIQMEGV